MIFVSASVTAIFSAKLSRDPLKSGSYGVGFTINKGVYAKLSDSGGVFLNGEKISFPTVEFVLRKLNARGVELRSEVPISCGFGVSGASALATALEIAVRRNIPFFKAADVAHEAEVTNRTGLGDVVTQCFGGVVVRLKAGSPSRAVVNRYLFKEKLDFLVMGELPTEDVLKREMKNINRIGKKYFKEFLRKPSVSNLFSTSKKFAIESGLADDDIINVIEAVESYGGKASMIMLGKGVFALNGWEAFKEFKGEKFQADIDLCSCKIL